MSIPKHVTMQPVESKSGMSRMGHDPENNHLYVDFGTTDAPKVYRYADTSAEEFDALAAAPSKYRHFNTNIKNSKPTLKVPE